MPEHEQTDRYLTLTQVSAILGGRSRSSIYRDIGAGRLPAPIHFGGRIYWRAADVHQAVQSAAEGQNDGR